MDKKEITNVLEDSQLFWEECPSCKGKGFIYGEDEYGMNGHNYACNRCDGTGKILVDLDADTSEKILSGLGLQVVWYEAGEIWCFAQDLRYYKGFFEVTHTENIYSFVKKGERTLANNAAIAWLTTSPKWLNRLKVYLKKD